MNILFISKLSGNLWAGPNNSVPAQIKAQSVIDKCFWYNLNQVKRKEWMIDGLDCKNLTDYPSGRLKDLPAPFNKPDIAVVEEVYCFPFEKIIQDLIRSNIPYVIVPRSTLTSQAQNNKRIKKIIGNALWFHHMVNSASAIQYLTNEEKIESEAIWKKNGFIVPNGISIPKKQASIKNEVIRGTYIGRIEIYQKGFDLMISVLSEMQEELRRVPFHLSVYGPDRDGATKTLEKQIQSSGISDIISFHNPVFGEEKEEILSNTDLFFMTSRFEGLPMGLIEALSYGIPCIATKGTNLSDVIDKYDAGWVAENNKESIVEAVKKMISERTLLGNKGRNARELADNYSWNTIAEQSHEQYLRFTERK